MNKVHLVVPVYNDWESFRVLLHELDAVAASLPFQLFVSAVDDGSIDDPMPTLGDLSASTILLASKSSPSPSTSAISARSPSASAPPRSNATSMPCSSWTQTAKTHRNPF